MNRPVRLIFLITLLSLLIVPYANAQELFEDPDGNYKISLPAGWLGIVNKDSLGRTDVNIVFRVRENGSLKIRGVDDYDPEMDLMEFVKEDENQTVRFVPGYKRISIENFLAGTDKKGVLLSYDYQNASGQPFTGRIYYLMLNEKSVYVLKFVGRKNILGTLRNQTDAIARSFEAK